MSLRKYLVQYIGSCLRLPELERDVTLIATCDGKKFVPEERLDRACSFIAEQLGTCPLDMFDFQAKDCDSECDDTYAGCWKRYFASRRRDD